MNYYNHLLQGIRSEIEIKYGSISRFCKMVGVSRQNLSEVFSGHQDISVGLYLKICVVLKIVAPDPTTCGRQFRCKVSLRDYLEVDNNLVYKSIFSVIMDN